MKNCVKNCMKTFMKNCKMVLILMGIFLGSSLFSESSKLILDQDHNQIIHSPSTYNYSPTIVQTTEGLLLAWIGASTIRGTDASVFLSQKRQGAWSLPKRVASSIDVKTQVQTPCERPVLFKPVNGKLLLFYKTLDLKKRMKGMLMTSENNGKSWLPARLLPRSIYGPSRTKPIELPGGTLLCGSDSHKAGWIVHIERGTYFRSRWGWRRTRGLSKSMIQNAREPVLLDHGNGKIQALCRTKRGYLVESWSDDNGKNWGSFERNALPNPDGGLDAVKIREGEFVMIYQHSNRGKGILNLAKTKDGKEWSAAAVVENQPERHFSDPAMIIGSDGNLHLVYSEDHKHIKYVLIDPSQLSSIPIVKGNWPH